MGVGAGVDVVGTAVGTAVDIVVAGTAVVAGRKRECC